MDVKDLTYFYQVAIDKNISKAAQNQHISQPAISRAIKDLEKELGKKLLRRGNRGITLTEEGEILFKRAKEILNLVENTKNEIGNIETNLLGDVYIGAGEFDNMHFLARAAKILSEKYPKVKFHIVSGNYEEVLDLLKKGLIDIGVVVSNEKKVNNKYRSLIMPSSYKWGIIIPRDHELANRESVSINDLKKEDLIISQDFLKPSKLEEIFGEDISDLNIKATYTLLFNASIMVKERLGVLIGIENILDTSADSTLKFIPFSNNSSFKTMLLWKKDKALTKASQEYLNILIDLLKESI